MYICQPVMTKWTVKNKATNSNFMQNCSLCWDCFFCQSLFCINWIIADSIFSQCIAKLLCHSTTHSFSRIFWDTRWTGIFYISYYSDDVFNEPSLQFFEIRCSLVLEFNYFLNNRNVIQAGKKTEETLSCRNPANISNK